MNDTKNCTPMRDLFLERFVRFYGEKLWNLIPEVYRHEDGIAENPGVLRAIVEILGVEAARLRWGHDRLWENQWIETCEDWAVPYIGQLIGARPLSTLNSRGARVDVAKTVYYRRRKGTPAVLEQLISDIAGWEGKIVESFMRLPRAWHGLDGARESAHMWDGLTLALLAGSRAAGARALESAANAGEQSWTPGAWTETRSDKGIVVRTPSHGVADLRSVPEASRVGGPWESYSRVPDFRRPGGTRGLWNIPQVVFHLYRREVCALSGVHPYAVAPGLWRFDPSGRDVPLYAPRTRSDDWSGWKPAQEWEVPGPISCYLLGQEVYRVTGSLLASLINDHAVPHAQADELRALMFQNIVGEGAFRGELSRLPSGGLWTGAHYETIVSQSLSAGCGKAGLWSSAMEVYENNATYAEHHQGKAASLQVWGPTVSLPSKNLLIDPDRGRFEFTGGDPSGDVTVSYHVGGAFPIGACGQDRPEVEERTPTIIADPGGGALSFDELDNAGVAQIEDSATYGPIGDKLSVENLTVQAANQQRPYLLMETNWVLNTAEHTDSLALLDGLWIGATDDEHVVFRGDYECVTIRHCTLDPGGERDPELPGDRVPPVVLEIDGTIETLVIYRSVLGEIRLAAGAHVESIQLTDCIWQAPDATTPVLSVDHGELQLDACTVVGDILPQTLWCTDSLIDGTVTVENSQEGCFRYSAAHTGSRVPRPHRHWFYIPERSLFQSKRFGDDGYMQPVDHAPQELLRGGENRCQMGVGNRFLWAVKQADLESKVNEYMPFGMVPAYVNRT